MASYASRLERANYHHLVWDIGWFAVALASTTRFLQFYAIRMGADAFALGLMTALPAMIVVISSGFSSWWRNRYPDSVQAIWFPSLIFRLVFLLPAFAPFFPIEWRVLWLIMSAVVPAMTQGMSNAIFMVVMRETVSDERIPSLLARRQFALNMMLLLGVVGFGLLLEFLVFPLNYQVMFVIAFGFALASQWHLTRLSVIAPATTPPAIERNAYQRLSKDDGFLSIAFMALLSFVAFFSIFAIVPLFLERNLGADESYIATFGLVELIAGASAILIVEPLFRHWGSRKVISMSLVVIGLAALALALSPSLPVALIGAALTGAGWNLNNVATLRFYTERTRPNDMAASTAYQQIIYLSMFIGPMLGSLLVESGISLAGVLVVGAVLRVGAAVLTHYGLSIFGRARVNPMQ